MSIPWKAHHEYYNEALVYMRRRQKGRITSFVTPWPKVNSAAINGFEWNSIVVLAARPGGGKTLMKDQLIREGFKLNKAQGIRALEFQFEMVGRNSKLREFSAVTGKSYKYLCSAENEGITVTDDIINTCQKHAEIATKYPIDIVDTPMIALQFKNTIEQYVKTHSKKDSKGFIHFPKTVVTLDHSVLVKKAKGQSTLDMLAQLGEVCTELKKKYPILFIILSQLNRDITSPSRCENGKYGNYPNPADIFGADSILQHADFVGILDRPALRHITAYGPERFVIEDDTTLCLHVVKSRTGDTRMSFFKAEFERMSISEMETPRQEPIRTRKK